MFEQNIENMKRSYTRRSSVKITIGLALSQWLAYKLSDNQEYLHDANSITVLKLRENQSHLRLFLLTIFFAIELKHFDKANEMLKIVYKYRSYYKKNQPADYMRIHFLYALVKIRQGQPKAAKSHVSILDDFLMLGIVQLELGQFNAAYENLTKSYAKGCRSIILWTSLFRYYEVAPKPDLSMLVQTMSWAITRDANIKGIHYYRLGTLEYYRKAHTKTLDGKYLEDILDFYMQNQHYEDAADLISRQYHKIADKTLWAAIKELSEPAYEKLHSTIAIAAYELMCKSRYGEKVANLVLKYFDGTQEQWIELSKALDLISIEDFRLDETILNAAVDNKYFDEDTQKIFIRNAEQSQDFIYYFARSIILDDLRPINEMIIVLEEICLNGDSLVAYALCHIYANYNIPANEYVIKMSVEAQEHDNLLFPIFKSAKLRGKFQRNTYIEKYRPFMHKALPGKDVYLYYKFDENEEWVKIRAKHWKFGIYMTQMPHFYNETVNYYFSEELPTGSVSTTVSKVKNEEVYLSQNSDSFFEINNALIHKQMFKYDQVEEVLNKLVKDVRMVRSRLL